MQIKSLDKLAGILSVLWTVGGCALFRFGVPAYPKYFGSIQFALPIMLLGWFGVCLLLVIAGIRRGNCVNRTCSILSIGFLLWLTEPLHRIGGQFSNLFRKDEYAFVYQGAPECGIQLPIHNDQEIAKFEETVRQFAKQQNIRACHQKLYVSYSGPPRPEYKGEHVAIWSGVWWTTNASQKTGSIRLAPYDEKYPASDFKRLEDSLVDTMRTAFPGTVTVTLKEAKEP
jgi:hypothetical protein